MANEQTSKEDARLVEKEKLRAILHSLYAEMGFEYDPEATAQQSREFALEDGVRPEDKLFSCGIIAARDEE
jgi:hypothetical protein